MTLRHSLVVAAFLDDGHGTARMESGLGTASSEYGLELL